MITPSAAPLTTPLLWLGGVVPRSFQGTTWGIPWPQGALRAGADQTFAIDTDHPLQSWPLAFWPDGSIKWSAHALAPIDDKSIGAVFELKSIGAPKKTPTFVVESHDEIRVDTGKLCCTLKRRGKHLFESLQRPGSSQATNATLIALVDEGKENEQGEGDTPVRCRYTSEFESVVIENAGPARVLIKACGTHQHPDGRAILPFTIRIYFYRNSDSVRIIHNFIYDLDEQRECVRGIGLRFDVPLEGPLHERYVRFVGDNGGVFAEAVRGLSGLRRDSGKVVMEAQLRGEHLTAIKHQIEKNLGYVPSFGDYSLLQPHPDGFSISKRTGTNAGWIHAATGSRSAGTGYLGTAKGGVFFGVRNFWQSYPGQLDIQGAATELGRVTLWLWAPNAPGMDLRFYHDGMGETDYAKQLEGLDITYEDYEPGFGRPYGIARTSELELQLTAQTPSAEQLVILSQRVQNPPQLITSSKRLFQGQAFSEMWSPATATPTNSELERQLAWSFDYYREQVEQRKWYGFWDYGDVMHTYDTTRHVWRYDVGGFAWDNSELSTEIWLWHYFLHSGRADVFRLAEAMTRHVGEVDVHHIGPFSPLGSRHNVQHWGDSAKQLRISTAINRRFLYYLSADERVGDLLHEQADAVNRLVQIVPGRKLGPKITEEHSAEVGFGTDWGATAAAWLTEWERTGNTAYRDKLITSMATIAAQPHGFFTGAGYMDLRNGAFIINEDGRIAVSHLSAAFGLPEICSELIRAIPDQAFRKVWLDYCVLYNADADTQIEALGKALGSLNLGQGHSKLLGYAGKLLEDETMKQQAWRLFFQGNAGLVGSDFVHTRIDVPQVLSPVDEAPAISTNAVAQWGLAAISLLAHAPEIQSAVGAK
nr:Tat pathway signal sequence domain protein [Uliginosibacterium gangwonense]